MRVGKWVPVYKRMLPVPQRLAMAFGLAEQSQLYLMPVRERSRDEPHVYGYEIMASPIPPGSWRSVCRLSVRLRDTPGALTVATRFLRDKRVNILFSESSSTFQHRAHWDAICDLGAMEAYAALINVERSAYQRRMEAFLRELSLELEDFMEAPENRDYFLIGTEKHAQFSTLTGLNDASFACDYAYATPVRYSAGGIDIGEKLARVVSRHCSMEYPMLPDYAMITGNTEQRYLRVLFLRDYDNLFRVIIETRLSQFTGGCIGILNQILAALPEKVRVIRSSSRLGAPVEGTEISTSDIIGHWEDAPDDPKVKALFMEEELRSRVRSLALEDLAGKTHPNATSVIEFYNPETLYPRVFVSYSTHGDADKVNLLLNSLWDSHFRPVVGTDLRRPLPAHEWPGTADIVQSAFQAIRGCVAFISLLLPHPSFKIGEDVGRARYAVPPWAVAEEVYAWSHGIRRIIRLRDRDVASPGYNERLPEYVFNAAANRGSARMGRGSSKADDYESQMLKVIAELNAFRATSDFRTCHADARAAEYQPWFPPGDV
jgi:hypothetical protein